MRNNLIYILTYRSNLFGVVMVMAWPEITRIFNQESHKLAKDPKRFLSLVDDMLIYLKYSEYISPGWQTLKETVASQLQDSRNTVMNSKDGVAEDEIEMVQALMNEQYLPIFMSNHLVSQHWLYDRMRVCGYDVPELGLCAGISHMAMHAFLANDLESFNRRLNFIFETDLEEFKDDFKGLKSQDEETMFQTIVDLKAFFDGVILHQDTDKYNYLFEDPEMVIGQDAMRASKIIKPIGFEEDSVAHISTFSGAYESNEIKIYLDTLEEYLGANSFSLMLGSAAHEINLNYNAESKTWLLVDPSQLPGVEFIHTEVLRDALLSAYHLNDGLVLQTSLYTTESQSKAINSQLDALHANPTWQALHKDSKLDMCFEDNRNQIGYAIARGDVDWLEEKFSSGALTPSRDMLRMAERIHNVAVIDCLSKHLEENEMTPNKRN